MLKDAVIYYILFIFKRVYIYNVENKHQSFNAHLSTMLCNDKITLSLNYYFASVEMMAYRHARSAAIPT